MSVENEILRIQHNIANTYAVVSDKGGKIPLQPTSANLAAAVESIPQTSGGCDGNPVGTVISFMGTSAPKDYLTCDGTVHNISDYPELAGFFESQFGTKNHFGGDGETTFAVPDMRNLFLRGYHGDSEEQLSGEIGQRQEATEFPHYRTWETEYWCNYGGINTDSIPVNMDKTIGQGSARWIATDGSTGSEILYSAYTSRPVNMAILYCIKSKASDVFVPV